MMKKILINTNEFNETRLAVLEDDFLFNLEIENKKLIPKKGNIYKGVITKVEPSLDAVFVNYGENKEGFLPFKEIIKDYVNFNKSSKNLLTKGKEILVQIEKEERKNKSAALTTYISLAGFYLVLMPSSSNLEGISRHIEGEMRNNLKDKLTNISIPDDMGIIVRTAGISKSLEELKWELNVLLAQYNLIKNSSKIFKAPCLIHEESDLIVRSVRDYLRSDIEEIIVDNIKTFNYLYKYLVNINSDFVSKIRLYCENMPLFSKYKVEQQIELAFKREIFLPSGGSIIIDHTEALVSIDVNSAKSNRCLDIKETALQTNLEAINEIARQMRLRDLGGLIIVDLIDMPDNNSQKTIEKKIKELILFDRAKIQIGKISKFGLLEMSRQRIRQSLSESNQEVCDKCNGNGKVYNIETLSNKILRAIEEESYNTNQINIEVNIKLMVYLLNLKKIELLRIEKVQNIKIIIIPNDQLSLLDYKIYKLKLSQKNKYKEMIKNNNIKGKKNVGINVKNDSHVSSIVKAIIKIIK
ncbi:Ribonuclease E [Candidatus Azoamicus ciliaticola]|uniref:Ribonuclease G n=2 Tax=Candidatus Azoamicus ciliaticola TaxID=2652803 RepID=A0A6J5JWY4_9GAMM|nr:Ribonuclease E [Candidatus Azoamicus ciliaticola]